jgi:hypothetical protein
MWRQKSAKLPAAVMAAVMNAQSISISHLKCAAPSALRIL